MLQSSRSLLVRTNARAVHNIRSRSLYPLIQYTPATFRLQSTSSNKQAAATTTTSTQEPAPPSESKASPPAVPQEPLATRVWKKVKHEAQHYWHGTKLLVSEVRISSRLQWKILQGETLTRRERRQVVSPHTRKSGILLTALPAETNNPRLVASGPLCRLHRRPLHGTPPTRRAQALPQYAALHIRGQVRRGTFGHFGMSPFTVLTPP